MRPQRVSRCHTRAPHQVMIGTPMHKRTLQDNKCRTHSCWARSRSLKVDFACSSFKSKLQQNHQKQSGNSFSSAGGIDKIRSSSFINEDGNFRFLLGISETSLKPAHAPLALPGYTQLTCISGATARPCLCQNPSFEHAGSARGRSPHPSAPFCPA